MLLLSSGSILNILTPRGISFRRAGTLICSAFAMRSLEHGGAISPVDPFDHGHWTSQCSPMTYAELPAINFLDQLSHLLGINGTSIHIGLAVLGLRHH